MDSDRVKSRAVRTAMEWVDQARVNTLSAFTALSKVAVECTDIDHKLKNDINTARTKLRALGYTLSYNMNQFLERPEEADRMAVVEPEAAMNMKQFVSAVKQRASAVVEPSPTKASPAKGSPSCSSAAGERARLGLAPPSKLYQELIPLDTLARLSDDYIECTSKEEIDILSEKLKPHRKALFELVGLCVSYAKELKGATASARKRIQEEKEATPARPERPEPAKRRRVAAAGAAGSATPDQLFEALTELKNAKVIDAVVWIGLGANGEPPADAPARLPFIMQYPEALTSSITKLRNLARYSCFGSQVIRSYILCTFLFRMLF